MHYNIWLSTCHWHAEKLDVDVATIQHGVEGLMYLITECAKLMVYLFLVALLYMLYIYTILSFECCNDTVAYILIHTCLDI